MGNINVEQLINIVVISGTLDMTTMLINWEIIKGE